MLISDEKQCVFIHIQKTGGETLTALLRARIPDLRSIGPKHGRVRDVTAAESDWNGYFVFAFVRNPWDRLVSWYSMIREAEQVDWAEARRDRRKWSHRRQVGDNKLWRYALAHSSDFRSFVMDCRRVIEVRPNVFSCFAFNQLDYLTDPGGRVITDFVGRFEHFHDGVAEVFATLGLGNVPALPHENSSRHGHYTTFYDEETAEMVRRRFARDIEHFGYTFGDERPRGRSVASARPRRTAAPPQRSPARASAGDLCGEPRFAPPR